MEPSSTLRIALQKSGRLTEESIALLKQAGMKFDSYKGHMIVPVQNFDIELLLIRDDDIPEYVQDGVCDIGFVGANVTAEKNCRCSGYPKPGIRKMPVVGSRTEKRSLPIGPRPQRKAHRHQLSLSDPEIFPRKRHGSQNRGNLRRRGNRAPARRRGCRVRPGVNRWNPPPERPD